MKSLEKTLHYPLPNNHHERNMLLMARPKLGFFKTKHLQNINGILVLDQPLYLEQHNKYQQCMQNKQRMWNNKDRQQYQQERHCRAAATAAA